VVRLKQTLVRQVTFDNGPHGIWSGSGGVWEQEGDYWISISLFFHTIIIIHGVAYFKLGRPVD
jgi:hypothetical protein